MENKEKLLDAKIEQIKKRAREQEERERRLQEEEELLLEQLGYVKRETPKHADKKPPAEESTNQATAEDFAEPLNVRSAHMDDPELTNAAKSAGEGLKWRDDKPVDPARGQKNTDVRVREWDRGKDQNSDIGAEPSARNRWNRNPGNRDGGDQSRHGTSNQRFQQSANNNARENSIRGPLNLRRNFDEEEQDRRKEPTKHAATSPLKGNSTRRGAAADKNYSSHDGDNNDNNLRRGAGRALARRPLGANKQPGEDHRRTSNGDKLSTGEEAWGEENPASHSAAVVSPLRDEPPADQSIASTVQGVQPAGNSNSFNNGVEHHVEESEDICSKVDDVNTHATGSTEKEIENEAAKQELSSAAAETLQAQASEEDQFEDVAEEWSLAKNDDDNNDGNINNNNNIEADAPSSAFASMSASSVDLQSSSTNCLDDNGNDKERTGTGENATDSKLMSSSSDATNNMLSGEDVANVTTVTTQFSHVATELVANAIDAALSVIEGDTSSCGKQQIESVLPLSAENNKEVDHDTNSAKQTHLIDNGDSNEQAVSPAENGATAASASSCSTTITEDQNSSSDQAQSSIFSSSSSSSATPATATTSNE